MFKSIDVKRVLILCFLGSFFRIIYGLRYEPWLLAPDHSAWELIIEKGIFRYDHLIHYPHEGGTILVSLISLLVEFVTDFSSLAVSAILIDFVVRFLQISVVEKVFGKSIGLLFGVWTIFSTPTIIPWGVLNFGLHSISSVFPFLLILFFSQKEQSIKQNLCAGIFLGLAVWFSYSNLILIPAFFIFTLFEPNKTRNLFYALLSLIGVLIFHLMVRAFFDAGFHLSQIGLMSIRGESFSLTEIDFLDRLTSLPRIIANSGIALEDPLIPVKASRLIYYLYGVLSIVGFYAIYKREIINQSIYFICGVVILFLLSYIFSPFFHLEKSIHFISFRHLTYILPLIALIIINGLAALKQRWMVITFLVFVFFQSIQIFTKRKPQVGVINKKAIGWVLGTKFGHDPHQLIAIIEDDKAESQMLIQGIGWGITTAIMTNDQIKFQDKINQQVDLFFKYPISYHEDLLEGIEFSYSDKVKPKLDQGLMNEVEEEIRKRSATPSN